MSNFQSSEQYLKLMEKDLKKHIQIISIFAQLKDYQFENEEQVQRFIQRNTRAAKQLDCYSIEKIKRVAEYLSATANFKWTLETILKYIDENVEALDGKEAILILTNGEKIYDISRLKQLESDQRISWDGRKWIERQNN